ncbi:hypothetical protein BH20CHL6_BH20CHL6_00090 [soil metagenome]
MAWHSLKQPTASAQAGPTVDVGEPGVDRRCDFRGTMWVRPPEGLEFSHRSCRTAHPFVHHHGSIIHPVKGRFSPGGSVGVDQLADRCQLAAQLVVLLALPADLVAGVQDGGVVATAELAADAHQ